jgi:DNA polymerase III gamma/tau subunit
LVFAKLAHGIPGRGLELAASQEYHQMRDECLELLTKLSESSIAQAMGYIDYFLDRRDNAVEILDMIELLLRDVLVLKQGNLKRIIVNGDKISHLEYLANSFTIPNIQCIIENIEQSKKLLKSRANFQLTIENLLMKIQGSGEHAQSSRSTV